MIRIFITVNELEFNQSNLFMQELMIGFLKELVADRKPWNELFFLDYEHTIVSDEIGEVHEHKFKAKTRLELQRCQL